MHGPTLVSTYVGIAGADSVYRLLRSFLDLGLPYSIILWLWDSFSEYSEAPELLLQYSGGSGIIFEGF